MYNPTELRVAFTGVVGLLQSNIPGVPYVSAPLTTSSSGIYAQDKHPLVSLENIFYSAPDFNINNYPIWSFGNNYFIGDQVNDGGFYFKSNSNLTGSSIAPHLDAVNWTQFKPYDDWLTQTFNKAVTNMFSEVVKLFKLQDLSKAILEKQQLFRGSGNRNEAIIPSGNGVGFEIITQQAECLLVQIDQLGTQFTQSQNLDFYLYHSSSKIYLKKFTVAVGANSSFSWSPIVNCIMMYLQQNTQGTYIFMYYESDLTGGNSAISKQWDCSSAPCSGCDGEDVTMYNRWSRYTAFRNIKISPLGLDLTNSRTLPDLSKATYGSQTNWGLNFSITVRCDLTEFITSTPFLWADSLAMQWCLELLRIIAQSTRIETFLAQIKIQARAELNLTERSTFINQYWQSINALKIDMSGFSEACQPCVSKSKGGKWRSV